MVTRSNIETTRIRYLLGLCSQAERERIESEYFEDEAAFQAMLTAEDDLIDAYARGELTNEERQRFENDFLISLRERDRVKFARAFAGVLSGAQPLERRPHATVLDSFKNFRGRRVALRIATITVVIVLVVVLSWLLIERRRMTNELRELRAENTELSKQTDTSPPSEKAERTHIAETIMQPENLSARSDKSKQREDGTRATQRTNHLPAPKVKNNREKIADSQPIYQEQFINTQGGIIDSGYKRRTVEIPSDANNVVSLLSLQPSVGRPFSLEARTTSSSDETTISIASSLDSIRLRLSLETAAQYTKYRAVIKTADGRPVKSFDWIEPLTPNRTSIDTPAIPTVDLPSGDYALLLMGKGPDGLFVRIAEYSFKVIKN